jgi:F-type H+-transporting ATPase subunit b
MKLLRLPLFVAPLALAASLFLAAPALAAQDSHATPVATTHTGATHAETSVQGHAAPPEGGEHHGPEIKLFGKALHPGLQFVVRLINFAIVAGGIFFLLKGALSSAFKSRAKELEELLSQAEKDKAEGEAQLKELEAKMASLQGELEGIMTKAEVDAEAERKRILEAARTEADAILVQTQAEIERQKRQAEKELRALVAELVVESATNQLQTRLQGVVASGVLDKAIEQVGGVK